MTDPLTRFDRLRQHFRKAAAITSAAELLEWDERTGMPRDASDFRAEQVATLRGIVHRMHTADTVEEDLNQLANWSEATDPHSDIGATVRLLQKDFEKRRRLPTALVEAIASATVRGQGCWDAARKADDYKAFQPALNEMISLKREAGEALAEPHQSPYEALLDEYEPDTSVATLNAIFSELQVELVSLLREVGESKRQVDDRLLRQDYPIDRQRTVCRAMCQAVGFDFQRGRLDETSHPFCTTLGPSDCRILTRYDSSWLPTGIFGSLHEAGHGLYEQGLRPDWFGLPPGSFVSLGVHESQSRLWENLVGRSLAFWQCFTPLMQQTFTEQLSRASADELHACFNRVEPSLIRVEADEATYNLHIIIRFELEQALLAGDLSTDDLPNVWAQRYEDLIGVRPPSFADGVLQDVHWSAGLFGYFPTYTLGNLIAAQLYTAAEHCLGDLDGMIRHGDFAPLLQWLRTHIHTRGRNDTRDEMIHNATGNPLSAQPLINSLRTRYASVYDVQY